MDERIDQDSKPQDSNTQCRHRKLRGPQFIGENGALCDDCDEQVTCPHPEKEEVVALGGPFESTY
jgi:hypothetical protein